MSDRQDFLFEIGTEELPPRALRRLGDALAAGMRDGLMAAGLAHDELRSYATPRRLAVLVTGLAICQPGQLQERRGPALTAAFDSDGGPTPAALGFARSCGVTVEELETLENNKGAWLVFRQRQADRSTAELLPALVRDALAALPIPKRMRWGSLREAFVRPVHWLVLLFGGQAIETELFGQRAGRETRGHRFHHPGSLSLPEPAAYAALLASEGHVMADFSARREIIRDQVMAAAAAAGGRAVIDEALLDEVTGMIEWPVAVVGHFERRYLAVPPEALISAMKGHQKYFHLVDEAGQLLPRFITISNIESRVPEVVQAGNERVIRPRLADAAFFWEQDRRTRLADRIPQLQQVVFQKKLGDLLQKSERVASLAGLIAGDLGSDPAPARRAGMLAKCDLLTAMVGEFPELQGIMGRYYARHDGEDEAVADALDAVYLPRCAGDRLPTAQTGQALAIADKLDSLVGIFGIGLIPGGDKDPFALRRAALGVLRIIIEQALPLDLQRLLAAAAEAYRTQADICFEQATLSRVFDFMMERLRAFYHEQGVAPDVFAAVLSRRPPCPLDFDARVRAVTAFRRLPEAGSLAAANKRIGNILRKAADPIPETVDEALLQDEAERLLAIEVADLEQQAVPLLAAGRYEVLLELLSRLRGPVDHFFDQVMVMCEDEALRSNRLALLNRMRQMFLRVADLSNLQD